MQPVLTTPVSAAVNLRRSAIVGAALGVASIVVLAFVGHPLLGVFACLGIALGAVNNRMLQLAVLRYGVGDGTVDKRRFRNGVVGRLGGITLVAVAVGLLVRPDGLGVFAGLAVFQILMLVGAALPVFRSLRPSS